MITHRITLTSKGQITLPAEIRRQLGLETHDQLTATIIEGKVLLAPDELSLEDVIGSLPSPPGLDPGDFSELIDEAIEAEARSLTEEFLELSKE
jgi:AbrB family looped-hinge helix DNA binding protein